MVTVSALGAMVALVVAIGLILKSTAGIRDDGGALAGGLVGGADLVQTVTLMVTGARGSLTRCCVFWRRVCWRGY